MNQKIQELKLLMQSDPKKACVLGMLMLVLAVLGAKQFIGGSPGEAAAQDAVDAVHDEVLGLSDIESIVQSGPTIRVPRGSGRMRDLFRFDDQHFPQPAIEGEVVERSAKSDDGPDDPTPVDTDAPRREAERIREEAERFRLTSTLLGTQPIAVFEYRTERNEPRAYMLRIGEVVRGFTLVSVSHRNAVIEQNDQHFTLVVED